LPFVNSIPARSSAPRSLMPVSSRPPNNPSAASSRLTVGTETPANAARSSWDQPSSARAAGARPQASDEFVVPLCRSHHRAVHPADGERALCLIAELRLPVVGTGMRRPIFMHQRQPAGESASECAQNGQTEPRTLCRSLSEVALISGQSRKSLPFAPLPNSSGADYAELP
jgi:hypothetical protein